MSIHVCFSTKPNCWNFEAKCYGTCYGCGCCVKDKVKRYKNRIAYLHEMLKEQYEFDGWEEDNPEVKALQERNVKINIRYFKRMKRYYEKKLRGERMSDEFKEGQYIIYKNGDRYEIGKIKRITSNGAFIYYSSGDTASKTPFECMHKITNEYVIGETSLGGVAKTGEVSK